MFFKAIERRLASRTKLQNVYIYTILVLDFKKGSIKFSNRVIIAPLT